MQLLLEVVWMLGKNTILKAIHNVILGIYVNLQVWMLGKNTILKAIHNKNDTLKIKRNGVNAG